MRAVRIPSYNAPLEATTLPDVSPGPREVKVSIAACGICHSDAHYRGGFGATPLPRTPGHEIAGVVSEAGAEVSDVRVGDRVAVHYLISCGGCRGCTESGEQFCETGEMIGKHRDGGYAESIVVPARNAIPIPPNVSFEAAAIMMCSTATAYHALRLANVGSATRLAILGFGGLGVSAFHLAKFLGAASITVIDIVPEKLRAAEALGARDADAFDVAIDFTGRADVIASAFRRLAPGGCLVLVALSEETLPLNPYRDILAKDRRLLGCSDHLREELFDLMRFAANGDLDVSPAISRRVPLDAGAINAVLDDLERGTGALRTVIWNAAAAPPHSRLQPIDSGV
jgi:propanol-preferring alcohol dehydrogenase